MRGTCLCGKVEFEVEGTGYKLYQCHCSLCRKQGGSVSNTATIVPNGKFRWTKGADNISSWVKDTGFRSDFCKTCGATVPNPLRTLPLYWIPAGALDDADGLEIVAQVYLSSKAPWDTFIPNTKIQDEHVPDLSVFAASLQPAK